MYTHGNSKTGIWFVFLLASWLLTGCGGGGSSTRNYYLINPEQTAGARFDTDGQMAIEIIDLHIPQYLERYQIATRSGNNTLHFSDANQWGENLRENLMRTMARNLSTLLSTPDISTPLNRSASLPDYRIQIHVEQFEQDIDGKVKLLARWQMTRGTDLEPSGTYTASLESQERIAGGDYGHLVSSMQDLYGQLARNIAGTIIEEAGN